MAFLPDVDVGANHSEMPRPPTSEGGTIVQAEVRGDLNADEQLQGPVSQTNPFQECNLFIGECAARWELAPMAALVRIQDILQAIWQQSQH